MRSLVTEDGSRTLYSPEYRQTYRSQRGALSEAVGVFLRGSGVEQRLAAGKPSSVLEVGFGTGLNFLVTACQAAASGTPLWYTSLERRLPPGEVLGELAYGELLAPSPLPAELLAWLCGPAGGATAGRQLFTPPSAPHVTLELLIGDALESDFSGPCDAVYLDAFSPNANPEPWQPSFLARLAATLAPGGRLVSYSVSGALRRALGELGLEVSKVRGPPGGKREALVAVRRP